MEMLYFYFLLRADFAVVLICCSDVLVLVLSLKLATRLKSQHFK